MTMAMGLDTPDEDADTDVTQRMTITDNDGTPDLFRIQRDDRGPDTRAW